MAIVALAVVVLGLTAALAAVGTSLSRERRTAGTLRTATATWRRSAGDWERTNEVTSRMLHTLQDQVAKKVGDLDHPDFSLWNACGRGLKGGCHLSPGSEYVGGVPDTFTYVVSFHSTVPVTVWIMSTHDFICWETSLCHWNATGWKNRTELRRGVFHNAEGCAGYMAVFVSEKAGTFYPDIHVVRRPAQHPTGVCR